MQITKKQVSAAYELGKAVFDGRMAFEAAAKALNATHGMNINTARDFINDYRLLRSGEVFQRALSAPAMDHFFSRILADSGAGALASAIVALRKHIDYYEGIRSIHLKSLRGVADKHEALLTEPVALDDMLSAFDDSVEKALNDGAAARRARLLVASKQPVKVRVTAEVFARNPDVVAEVRLRAAGVCERCGEPAPFLRRVDNKPYLEVHHVKRLADGGDDSVDNAIAVCPNCHREEHFGAHGVLAR